MITAARAVVPDLKQVAIVGDRWETQTAFAHLENELPGVKSELDVIDLMGLPMTELRKRVSALPKRTAILYTAIYSDGAGTYFPPADALAMFAGAANWPIISPVESSIGRGTTGDMSQSYQSSAKRPRKRPRASSTGRTRPQFPLPTATRSGKFSIGASCGAGAWTSATFPPTAKCGIVSCRSGGNFRARSPRLRQLLCYKPGSSLLFCLNADVAERPR